MLNLGALFIIINTTIISVNNKIITFILNISYKNMYVSFSYNIKVPIII